MRGKVRKILSGKADDEKAINDVGLTVEEFRAHISSQFQSGMTWENRGQGPGRWGIDHVVPLRRFDLASEGGRAAANHYSNLAPMWWAENQRKGSRDAKGGRKRSSRQGASPDAPSGADQRKAARPKR